METDMTGDNLNFIFEDCFDSSTLSHISPTPLPKPSPKRNSSFVQQSEPMTDSPNLTPITPILENAINLVDSKHLTGETTNY